VHTDGALQLDALLTVNLDRRRDRIMLDVVTRIVVVAVGCAPHSATRPPAPPKSADIALASVLTAFVMGPVVDKTSYDDGIKPWSQQIGVEEALQNAPRCRCAASCRRNVREKDLKPVHGSVRGAAARRRRRDVAAHPGAGHFH